LDSAAKRRAGFTAVFARPGSTAERFDADNQTGRRPQSFAGLSNRTKRYDRMPRNGTPDASSVMPKWFMHPMPNVRLARVVAHSRFLQVAPYVKVCWSRQQAAARAQ